VLRALATVGGVEQIPVARAAPLASFPDGSPARTVVDAFIAGRLLVAASEKAEPTVRLAHEALLSRWSRAGEQLAADRRDLDIRALIERQQSRWEQTTDRAAKQQLLLRDPDLANAIDLDRRWGDELTGDLRAFIAQSRATARAAIRRRWSIAATVILCLAALAGASITALYIAETLRNNALIAQSRFLARDARLAVSQGNATLGALLALAALPKNLNVPDRPFITDAEYALEDAFAAQRERVVLPHPAPVKFVSFSPDGARLASVADDKKVRIWDTDEHPDRRARRSYRSSVVCRFLTRWKQHRHRVRRSDDAIVGRSIRQAAALHSPQRRSLLGELFVGRITHSRGIAGQEGTCLRRANWQAAHRPRRSRRGGALSFVLA